jgi:hypothetical protein
LEINLIKIHEEIIKYILILIPLLQALSGGHASEIQTRIKVKQQAKVTKSGGFYTPNRPPLQPKALMKLPQLPRDCIACLNGFFLKEYRFIMNIYRNNFRIQVSGNHDNHPWRAGAQFGAS